jgi:hypothetical protein
MDRTDAQQRARQLWGRRVGRVVKVLGGEAWGCREADSFNKATGRWVDGQLHALDQQGHAICHARCSAIEAQADMPPEETT